jgi:hypothetical protein
MPSRIPHHVSLRRASARLWCRSRREFLRHAGGGFGALALSSLLNENAGLAAPRGRARSVIFLFMEGGPSAIDLFDPKPKLQELAGKPLPPSFGEVLMAMGEYGAPLLPSRRRFARHGQSGTWVSDWLPHLATCVDDIAVIRSCVADGINHASGVCQMNTGSQFAGRPSLGAWVNYGLGTENRSLPGFVVMTDSRTQVVNGPRNWGAGFMPAVYQGMQVDGGAEPIRNLATPASVGGRRQERKRALLAALDHGHPAAGAHAAELEARIRSYELAFRMQAEAPVAVNLDEESAETRALYGMDQEPTAAFGRNCLLARRLVERGVRFVQLYNGAGSGWDAHKDLEGNHAKRCASMDKPVAGLLQDLKRRGLLDSTLVVWGGEFGRTPMSEKGNGRDHNPYGFTMWMAGGGVRGGLTLGATDELGLRAVEQKVHVHDLHATILHLLGLDHRKLVYHYKGRPERATLNEGEVVRALLA